MPGRTALNQKGEVVSASLNESTRSHIVMPENMTGMSAIEYIRGLIERAQ